MKTEKTVARIEKLRELEDETYEYVKVTKYTEGIPNTEFTIQKIEKD